MLMPIVTYAQTRLDPLLYPEGAVTFDDDRNRTTPTYEYSIQGFRNNIVFRITSVLLGIAGIVAVYFIVANGFFLVVSAGQEDKVTQHKKGLMWAIAGLLLIILSYSIISFIINLTFVADQGAPAAEGAPALGGEGAGTGATGAGAGDLAPPAQNTPSTIPRPPDTGESSDEFAA